MRRGLRSWLACTTWLCVGTFATADEKPAETAIVPAEVKLDRPVEFERDIVPILDANCVACHNSVITESKFSLESGEDLHKGGKRGAVVVPGKPDESLLYQLAARGKGPAMPPMPNQMSAEPLTPQELGLLRQWIVEGAQAGSGRAATMVQWRPLPSGLDAIYSVALSPWGRFAAAGRANQVTIYDISAGAPPARLTDPNLQSVQYEGQPMYPDGAAHRDFVHALAFSPDGTTLASAGYRVVKLWRRPENVQTAKINAPNHVSAVAASADGKWIALGTADNQIKLTDAQGQNERALAGHAGAVNGLAFSADGTQLVSGSQDNTIRVWKIEDGSQVRQIATPAPVSDVCLNKEGTRVVSAHADNIIRVWDLAPPAEGTEVKPVLELKGHGGPVTSIELILPNGTQLVSGSDDGTVRIWDINNGNQIRAMGHGGPVTDVAARADGLFVASAGANNVAKLWQVDNGQQKAEMKGLIAAQRSTTLADEEKRVAQQIAGIMNGRQQAADKNLKDREQGLKTAQETKANADKALEEPTKKVAEATQKVDAAKAELAQKPDDQGLKDKVAGAEKELQQANEALQKAKDAQTGAARAVEFATMAVETAKKDLEKANADKAAADERQKAAEAAHAQAQQAQQGTETPFRAIAFAPDSNLLATGGDNNVVQLWSGETGQPLEALTGHGGAVLSLTFAAGGRVLSGSADNTAVAWDADPNWQLAGQIGPQGADPLDVSTSPFVGRVLALDFSPDGKLLATGGGDPSRSGELMIWNVETRQIVHNLADAHSDTVLGVAFSRDGKLLLSGAADKFAKIFDVTTGQHVRSFEGHTHHVLDVAWKADGQTIATAGADNAIKVWTVETGEQQRTMNNHTKQVTSLAFMGVDENLVTGSGDQTVRFFKATNGQNYRTFGGSPDFVYSVAATRDESLVIGGGEDGALRVWDGKNSQLIKMFEPPKPPQTGEQQANAGS